ncbi:MAG: hypothetical protein RR357_00370 [Clostridia bacterium]
MILNDETNKVLDENSNETKEVTSADFLKPCPNCGAQMNIDEKTCKKCGYSEDKKGGYVPMTVAQTKRIRTILFFILMIVALAIYFFTRK